MEEESDRQTGLSPGGSVGGCIETSAARDLTDIVDGRQPVLWPHIRSTHQLGHTLPWITISLSHSTRPIVLTVVRVRSGRCVSTRHLAHIIVSGQPVLRAHISGTD